MTTNASESGCLARHLAREGARDEHESAVRVRDMFTRIAPRYDFPESFPLALAG